MDFQDDIDEDKKLRKFYKLLMDGSEISPSYAPQLVETLTYAFSPNDNDWSRYQLQPSYIGMKM